ncbi:MAG: TlpA family protein disulfide reductase [Saprospiraceae bacterium]|nr:TlpA family protein disulfide reductase [Saprospiraceae bacterium]
MRKILPICLALILFLLGCQPETSSQQEEDAPPIKTSRVPPRNEVTLSLADSNVSLFTNLFADEFQDKPDMVFLGPEHNRWAITVPTTDSIRILGGDPMISFFYQVVLHRGDSLSISIDSISVGEEKVINYPVFELTNAKTPWVELNFDYLLYKRNLTTQAFGFKSGSVAPDKQRDIDLILRNGIYLLDSLKQGGQVSADFYTKRKRKLGLDHARERIYSARNQKLVLKIENLNINLSEEKWISDTDYLSFLRTALVHQYFKAQARVKNTKQFDFITNQETFLTPKLQLAVLNSYLKSIYFVEKSQFRAYLKKFQTIDTNQIYLPQWENLLAKKAMEQELAEQRKNQKDLMKNLLGGPARTFPEILADEKGKVILVDFWASWCAPCRQEMPALHHLQEAIGKDKLALIQISIDQKYEAWARASKMEEIDQEKHNYLISNWESSDLYRRYKIKTIPRYLLFDTGGALLDGDAPRPSSPALIALIQDHI